MGRKSINEILLENFLVCPICRVVPQQEQQESKEFLRCHQCQDAYPVFKGVPLMLPKASRDDDTKEDIQKFWGELYNKAYRVDEKLTAEVLKARLKGVETLFRHRQHLAAVEMPLDHIKGKKILEIGPGAGAHSALFSSKGAHVVAMDLTLDRVLATAAKFDMIAENPSNFCVQGDGENLPFADHSFDIVYSNGVLHHTPDTDRAIQEVYRVVKPGGKAVIMLYARHSVLYWANLFPRAFVTGNLFRNKNWLGHSTEWMAKDKQKILNPETKVYSAKELRHIFRKFSKVSLRKNSFVFQHIPLLGKGISFFLGKKTGLNPDGELLYGHPWRNESKSELKIGRHAGFCYNILAEKF